MDRRRVTQPTTGRGGVTGCRPLRVGCISVGAVTTGWMARATEDTGTRSVRAADRAGLVVIATFIALLGVVVTLYLTWKGNG